MSYFTEIKPSKTSKSKRKQKWFFMLYHESGSQREDKHDYCAFLFRDEKRTSFGIKEFFDDDILHMDKYREMATRVICESEFRKTLLLDDPELPQLWKSH